MDITTETRETGTYATREIGMQRWPEGDQTWQAPGVRMELMSGRTRLATIKLEVAASKAEEVSQGVADEIEPWVQTLRYLDVVAKLRAELESVEEVTLRAEDQEEWGRLEEETRDEILAHAYQQDIDVVPTAGAALCRQIASRLRGEIARGQRLALAHAPDVTAARIHPAWTLPSVLLMREGDSLARTVASELLAGWASARDQRDPLITWAVQDAEVTRSDVQRITGVSRSTINRMSTDV